MDLKDFTLEMMLEYLKNKRMLSGLEQDILSSIKTLINNPVNRNNVILKITENKIKYADIWLQISMQPGAKSVNFNNLLEHELQTNLAAQIELMWLKEVDQINS